MNTLTTLIPRAHKPRPTRLRRTVAILAVTGVSLVGALSVDAADSGRASVAATTDRSVATFEGREIDLSKDWGEAAACWVDEVGKATCFRTEAMMDRALVAAGKDLAATNSPTEVDKREGARAAGCSSSLRLYRNNYYGGGVVYLSQRGYWINLSWYGFDNVVSSYRVGGCSSTFRSGSNGSGNTYWGGTWAWASKSSMSGWNNVLSSVYIY